MKMKFEWDKEKNAINIKKHGVSFEEAIRVFFDPMAVELYDFDHSGAEERWRIFGAVRQALIMVCYAEKAGLTRIISARKATQNEEEEYFYGYCKN